MERISCLDRLAAILAVLLIAVQASAAESAVPANAATAATQAANAKVLSSLPFSDKQDFEDAQRGLVARPSTRAFGATPSSTCSTVSSR